MTNLDPELANFIRNQPTTSGYNPTIHPLIRVQIIGIIFCLTLIVFGYVGMEVWFRKFYFPRETRKRSKKILELMVRSKFSREILIFFIKMANFR